MAEERGQLDRGDGIGLAWTRLPGRLPTVVFLPGLRSDMQGTKAQLVASLCAEQGYACLRLDYSGHGASGGRFEDGTVGRWAEDALLLLDRLVAGPVVLAGSSMGGWIALLVAQARPARVAGLLGIAAAPDFTERLMWASMMPRERETLLRDGVLRVPSEYGEKLPITRALIEDGREHLVLDGEIPVACPVRLLHGQQDPDVPWELSLTLAAKVASSDVRITLVKDGDHRLSRPADLALLRAALLGLLGECGGETLAVGGIAPAQL
ncbi:MAG: alpha/beta hydrolase [Acetobacteraceae bacterium]|nr:alpha/beta hydrolase [Acetobacteraceae bacterium]